MILSSNAKIKLMKAFANASLILLIILIIYSIRLRISEDVNKYPSLDKKQLEIISNLDKSGKDRPATNIKLDVDTQKLSAKSILVTDFNTDDVVYGYNISSKLPVASLNKLLTALTAVYLNPENSTDIVTINEYDYSSIPENKAGLIAGEKYKLNDLLASLLISSHNDTAYALALNFSGSIEEYTKNAQHLLEVFKLNSTVYDNPAGFDGIGFSTSVDLNRIARILLSSQYIRDVVASPSLEITDIDNKHNIKLKTTDLLLSTDERVVGLKTGTTDNAKQCLMTLVNISDKQFLITILGSDDRYSDSRYLINLLSDAIK